MEKIKLENNEFIYPMPVTLVGVQVQGKPNFLTVAWVSRVNYKPALIAVALGNQHYSCAGLIENKTFSLNVPGIGLMNKADYCGIVSGKNADKSKVFEVFYGELKTAPMIWQCPLNMECALVKTVDFEMDTLFIGEIKGAYTEEKYRTNGIPDIRKINPLILSTPDNNYWALGEHMGKAWSAGNDAR